MDVHSFDAVAVTKVAKTGIFHVLLQIAFITIVLDLICKSLEQITYHSIETTIEVSGDSIQVVVVAKHQTAKSSISVLNEGGKVVV